MDIQILKGDFNSNEALELIVKMTDIKIKFHESKICNSHQEEDIKNRETKIKNLQKSLHEIRVFLSTKTNNVTLESYIHIH